MRYLAVTARPTAAVTIADLGRVDGFNFAGALGRPELARADMIAAAVRRGDGGAGAGAGEDYYEWDLATAPKTCAADTQYLVGTCPYDKVCLCML
jgi:hypothetical protein